VQLFGLGAFIFHFSRVVNMPEFYQCFGFEEVDVCLPTLFSPSFCNRLTSTLLRLVLGYYCLLIYILPLPILPIGSQMLSTESMCSNSLSLSLSLSLLYLFPLPVLIFLIAYFSCSLLAFRYEYTADIYAIANGLSKLESALIKVHANNIANLMPDPWYAHYHYSHPSLAERLERIEKFKAKLRKERKKAAGTKQKSDEKSAENSDDEDFTEELSSQTEEEEEIEDLRGIEEEEIENKKNV